MLFFFQEEALRVSALYQISFSADLTNSSISFQTSFGLGLNIQFLLTLFHVIFATSTNLFKTLLSSLLDLSNGNILHQDNHSITKSKGTFFNG